MAVPKRRISKKKQSSNLYYKKNISINNNFDKISINGRFLKKPIKKMYFKLFSIYTFYSFTNYQKKPFRTSFKK